MVSPAAGQGIWIKFVPRIKFKLADGSIFDNEKAHKDEQISCELRVLNHAQRQQYNAIDKTLLNMNLKEVSDNQKVKISENTRNWINLDHDGKPVKTGAEFYATQSSNFIQTIESVIDSDVPLKEPEYDEKGYLINLGDVGN